MNRDLLGKMVFVPKRAYGNERVMYLYDIHEGRMRLIDCEGNGLRCGEGEVELREATKKEVAEDFLYSFDGKRRNLDDLGPRGKQVAEELYIVALDRCKQEASKYERF